MAIQIYRYLRTCYDSNTVLSLLDIHVLWVKHHGSLFYPVNSLLCNCPFRLFLRVYLCSLQVIISVLLLLQVKFSELDIFKFKRNLVCNPFACRYDCAPHAWLVPVDAQEGIGSPKSGVTGGDYELPDVCVGSKLNSREEQQELIIAKPSFYLPQS